MEAQEAPRVDTVEQAMRQIARQIASEGFALELRKLLARNDAVLCEIELKQARQGGVNLTLKTKAICKNKKCTFLRLE